MTNAEEREVKETDIYKEVDLNIGIDQKDPYENLFQQQYLLDLHNDFITNKESKKHNMNSHSKRFRDKIKINHQKEELVAITKRKIVLIDFWMNIWTEINWIRPAIIYKHDNYRFWEDIVVIPMTSYDEEKAIDTFDIKINTNDCDELHHESIIKIRQIKSISKKRLRKDRKSWEIKIIGQITNDEVKKQIDTNTRVMFWI